MKFKKFLGAVCSFLLATTSLLCGGPASAKNCMEQKVCVFMVNSGEELGDGKRDGDKCDKACFDTIVNLSTDEVKSYPSRFQTYCNINFRYIGLNQKCSTALQAMASISYDAAPDVFIVVANLSKSRQKVIEAIDEQLNRILEAQEESVLYSSSAFGSGGGLCGQEVYLNTVPVIIFGVVPKGMTQTTSDDDLVKIAKQIKLERQGPENGQFKYIHPRVFIPQSNGKHIGISIEDTRDRKFFYIFYVIGFIAEQQRPKLTLWKKYNDDVLPVRKQELARRKAEEARRKAEAKRKKMWGGGLCGLSAALIIGSVILGTWEGNQNKKQRKPQVPKTQVAKPQVQKSQVAANA